MKAGFLWSSAALWKEPHRLTPTHLAAMNALIGPHTVVHFGAGFDRLAGDLILWPLVLGGIADVFEVSVQTEKATLDPASGRIQSLLGSDRSAYLTTDLVFLLLSILKSNVTSAVLDVRLLHLFFPPRSIIIDFTAVIRILGISLC
jgi:hypothetical protein